MEIKQLKKILASFGLAGLLATAGLTLSGCATPPADQTSCSGGSSCSGEKQAPGTSS
ncbi:MAG: selenobiotic family radical SAM modification target peptide [Deltaproteobacteria bacterium]|jgi:radical SAM modification target selenobiotic family peptide|nr:selenobiotic family radical SAM modification target peptide [Deltaproteobacteria bacterium]